MKTRLDARLLMAVTVTAFFATSVYSGIGAGLEAYDPGPLSLLRLLSASAALAVYALLSRRVRLPARRELPTARAGVVNYLIPSLALAIVWVWLGERPTLIAATGGVITLSGVALVNTRGESQPSSDT